MRKFLLSILALLPATVVLAGPVSVSSDNGYYNVNGATDCAPVSLSITQSSAPAGAAFVKFHWGDGSSTGNLGLGASPSHTFSNAGTYDILAEYKNGSGNTIGWEYARVELFGDPGAMYSNQTAACPNDLVNFYVNMGWSSSPVNTYNWNFGDGTTETSNWESASHKYTSTGTYLVTVTVTGPCGTYNKSMNFTVGTGIPFSGGYLYTWGLNQNGQACKNDEVGFGFPTQFASWLLTYGDGQFSNTNWTHNYANTGTYVASVTLANGCGNSGTFYDTVKIVNNLPFNPYNAYVWNSSPVCPGQEVYLDVSSSVYQADWQFSNGSTSNGLYIDYTVTSSVDDTVYVTLSNGCGNDTTLMTIVDVSTNIPVDDINLTVPDSVCTGSYLAFSPDGFSDYNLGNTYSWNFGDGTTSTSPSGTHMYPSNGTYTVTLTVTNGCGNDSTQTAQVVVAPGVAPDPNDQFAFVIPNDGSCPGDTVSTIIFPYIPGSYSMDFGDGFVTSNIGTIVLMGNTYGIIKHAYTQTGSFNWSLTYTNQCGLSGTKTGSYTVGTGVPFDGDEGLFYDESLNICLGESINFYGYGGSTYEWDFGDNTGTLITHATLVPVAHSFQNPGVYTVHLRITNGCGATKDLETDITIPDNAIHIVTNTVDSDCQQSNGKAIAVVNGGTAPYDIYWSNGKNGMLIDSLSAGIYVVNVTDTKGCYSFGIATVSDAQAPAIVLNTVVNATCNGDDNGALDINVIGNSAPYFYSWSNGSHTEDLSGLVAGPYEIYVTDANGCISTASFNVGQPDPVYVTFDIDHPACNVPNGSVTANALGNSGPFTYVWSSGANNATLFNIPGGIYTVNVIDQQGCIITEDVAVSEENAMGGPVISLNSISPLDCQGGGSTIDISVYFANTPTYQWSNGMTTQDITVATPGEYTVHVSTSGGCDGYATYSIEHAAPESQNICMVSVDSLYNVNRVIWEKPITTEIDHFNIYRESSQAGLYYNVGSVDYDSLSVYTDYVANPMVQSWRYKITAVNDCGEESTISASHKTIHLNQNLGLIPGTVNLIWDHYEGFPYSTYYIMQYTSSGGWAMVDSVSSLNTSYTVAGAPLTDSSLFYIIEAKPQTTCLATRAQSNGTTRSNRTDNPVAPPQISSVEHLNPVVSGFNLYPNPNNGFFTIEMYVSQSTRFQVEIFDLLGQLVHSFQTDKTGTFYRQDIDLRALPTGVYSVRIGNDDGQFVKKVIKN